MHLFEGIFANIVLLILLVQNKKITGREALMPLKTECIPGYSFPSNSKAFKSINFIFNLLYILGSLNEISHITHTI